MNNIITIKYRLHLSGEGAVDNTLVTDEELANLLRSALADCEDAIRLDPHYGKAIFRRAEILLVLGEWPRALQDFEEAIKYLGSDKMIADAEVYTTILQEEIKATEGHSTSERAAKPVLAQIEKKVGNHFFIKKEYERASDHYSRAIMTFGAYRDPVLFTNRAAAFNEFSNLFAVKQRKSSKYTNETEEKSDDESSEESLNYIQELQRARNYYLRRALDDAERAISLDTHYAKAYWRKGQILLKMKQYKSALESLHKADELMGADSLAKVKRDLAAAKKAVLDFEGAKSSKTLDYDSIVMPRRCDLWNGVLKNRKAKRRLRNPHLRWVLQNIKENPASLKHHLRDAKIKVALQDLMTSIDPTFQMEDTESEKDVATVSTAPT